MTKIQKLCQIVRTTRKQQGLTSPVIDDICALIKTRSKRIIRQLD